MEKKTKQELFLCLVLAVIVFLILISFGQNNPKSKTIKVENINIKRTSLLGNPKTFIRSANNPTLVLVVTFHRSGSSWFGNLLSTTPNSFYLYEPLNYINSLHKSFFTFSKEETLPFLKSLYQCNFPEGFINFTQNWKEGYIPKKSCTAKCYFVAKPLRDACLNSECYTQEAMKKHCLESSFRIFKVVRLPLSYTVDLLNFEGYTSLKLIHLIRDPRGTVKSINLLVKNNRTHWTMNSSMICNRLLRDVIAFKLMENKFPDNLFQVKYEEFAQDQLGIAKEIWSYLEGDQTASLPRAWEIFAKHKYTRPSKEFSRNNPFNTNNKSPEDWQTWREDIPYSIWADTEILCYEAIEAYGFRHFNFINETRNYSIPVMQKYS